MRYFAMQDSWIVDCQPRCKRWCVFETSKSRQTLRGLSHHWQLLLWLLLQTGHWKYKKLYAWNKGRARVVTQSTLTKACCVTWKSWETTSDPLTEDSGGGKKSSNNKSKTQTHYVLSWPSPILNLEPENWWINWSGINGTAQNCATLQLRLLLVL